MAEDIESRLALLKREVDTLQTEVLGRSAPWYKNLATWISIASFLFSFGTTIVSYHRTNLQDVQSKRQELRGLLQRLASLPKENLEASKKYSDDLTAVGLVSGYINQEGTFLARNAAEIAKNLPAQSVSAAEYYAIADALRSTYDLDGVNEFLGYTINTKSDFSTEISALRMLADMKFIQGKPDAGRVEYQKALNIFSNYPQFEAYTRVSTNVLTEINWAIAEANYNLLTLGNQHLDSAEQRLSELPPSPGVEGMRSRIRQVRSQFASGRPTPNMVAFPLTTPVPTPFPAAQTPSP